MKHVLWTEVRRSPLRWWFPALVVLQMTVLLVKQYDWEFAWSETGAAAAAAASFSLPIAAMAAGWAAHREHRSGDISQLHAHSRLPGLPHVVQFGVTLAYILSSYAVTVLVAWATAVGASGWGVPWPGYLMMGVSFLTIATGFGYAACRFVGSRLAVPAVGMVMFAVWLMVDKRSPLTLQILGGYAGEEPAVAALAWRLVLALSLCGLAVMMRPQQDRRHPRGGVIALPVAATGLVMVAVAGMAAAGPLQVPRSAEGVTPVCTDTAIEICVWPDQAGFIPELERYALRLEELDRAGLDVPVAYTERGLLGHSWSEHPNLRLKSATGEWIRVGELTFHIAIDLDSPDECVTDATTTAQEWQQDLQLVVVWPTFYVFGGHPPPGNGGGPPFDRELMAEILALPEEEQIAWAVATTDRLTAERPCGDV